MEARTTHLPGRHIGFSVLILIAALCLGCDGGAESRRRPLPKIDPLSGQKSLRKTEQNENTPETRIPLDKASEEAAKTAPILEKHPDAGKKRDWEKDLHDIVGQPAGCLATRGGEAAPQKIEISVEAYVTESGTISRASASSSQLTEPELSCIRQRIEWGRFAQPFENAPRRINTTIILQQPNKQ